MERPYCFILVIHDLKIPNLPGLISHKRFSTYRYFSSYRKVGRVEVHVQGCFSFRQNFRGTLIVDSNGKAFLSSKLRASENAKANNKKLDVVAILLKCSVLQIDR